MEGALSQTNKRKKQKSNMDERRRGARGYWILPGGDGFKDNRAGLQRSAKAGWVAE